MIAFALLAHPDAKFWANVDDEDGISVLVARTRISAMLELMAANINGHLIEVTEEEFIALADSDYVRIA
jgi:hypothetical protein